MMNKPSAVVLLIALLCGLLLVGPVTAMDSANFAIDWDVMGGGGEPVASANFALDATIGQGVIGPMSSANYDICSGYWCAGVEYKIFLPLVMKNHS